MDLAAYLGTVVAVTTVAAAGMHALVRTKGGRFDDVTNGINRRIDDLRTDLGGRMDRVEGRLDRVEGGLGRVERRLDTVAGTALEPGRDG